MYAEEYGTWIQLFDGKTDTTPVASFPANHKPTLEDIGTNVIICSVGGDWIWAATIRKEERKYKIIIDDFLREPTCPGCTQHDFERDALAYIQDKSYLGYLHEFDPALAAFRQDPIQYIQNAYLGDIEKKCKQCYYKCYTRLHRRPHAS